MKLFVFLYSIQVEEEEMLVAELKKIEVRKKDREKKSQDLNKLITAAESKPITASLGESTSSIKQDPRQQMLK